jgi:hypothetical protein
VEGVNTGLNGAYCVPLRFCGNSFGIVDQKGCQMGRKPKPTAIVAVKVRMREELRQQLADQAKSRDISLNKEIENRLSRSFDFDMNVFMYQLIADIAVDTAYSRLGLSKPYDMIDFINARLGNEAAKTFAAGLVNSISRKERTND